MRLRHLFASPAFELSERRTRLVDLTKDLGHLLYRSVLFGRWKEKSLSLPSKALLMTGEQAEVAGGPLFLTTVPLPRASWREQASAPTLTQSCRWDRC